jgi:hypothetical protein
MSQDFFSFWGKRMIKQSLYEQIVIVVGREELAQMLRAEQGFEIEKIEDQQSEIRFTLGRNTELDEEIVAVERTEQKRRERLF